MTIPEWDAIRTRIKPLFLAAGITRCEIRLPGCALNNFLGFAHAKKRRNLTIPERDVVVLACNTCHDIIEGCPEPLMQAFVLSIIAKRPRQPIANRPVLVDSTLAQEAETRLTRLIEASSRPGDRLRKDWETLTAELARLRAMEAQPSNLAISA